MAAVIESTSTINFVDKSSTGSTLTITKPTGLSVGDYLIAHLSFVADSGSPGTWNTPSGWTSLLSYRQSTNGNSDAQFDVFYKVADSSDVSASNFTFTSGTGPGNTTCAAGALIRASGVHSISGSANGANTTLSPTFSNSSTPIIANSTILFLLTVADASQTTGSVASYAISTDNPSWTEMYDFAGGQTSVYGLSSGAYATRSQTTATGTSSVSLTNFQQNSVCGIVVLNPVTSVSVSANVGVINVVSPAVTTGPSGQMFSAHSSFEILAEGGGPIQDGYTGVPFGIQIRAVDSLSRTVLSYTGTPTISSTGTLSGGSGATDPFVSGVLSSHDVEYSNTGSFTITSTDGAVSGTSSSFDIFELSNIEQHKGNIFTPVKFFPGLSTVKHINIFMAPVSGISGTNEEAAIKFYFNQSATASFTKYVTRNDIAKGYVSFEINKPYVNAVQLEIEYFNSTNLNPSGTYSNLGVADFSPSFAEIIYEPTTTIR